MALRLLDMLFARPILTIPMAAEALGVTYPSAKAAVERLEAVGALRPAPESGQARQFVARDILAIVVETAGSNDAPGGD